ncbi:MAG: hypothetical protein GX556_19440 [Fibrobacter sp.]|nr:hypothetical protein [Fibrobacter sp.]
METAPSRQDVSSLIDNILKSKDPATVGLRRILHKKMEQEKDFLVYSPSTEEFDSPGKKARVLNQDEQRVLELEKKVMDLELLLERQKENARTAVQTAYGKGREEGYKDGYSRGEQEAGECYQKSVDQLQSKTGLFLREFEESKREVFSNAEHMLVRLCTEMVKKIISVELSVNGEIILSVLKKALGYIGDRDRLIVRVSPDDFEAVSGRKDFWVPVADRLKNVNIEADQRVSRGGCIIESNSGVVDARLGVQYEELAGLVESVWESINSSARNGSGAEELRQSAAD